MLTSKIITEMTKNHSEFSECRNSCNKLVSSRSWQTMELPMILLSKAGVLEEGVRGLQPQPHKFWLAKNLGKSPENPGKNTAQHCLPSKNGAQGLHKNTWTPFFGGYTKKRSSWSLWEKTLRQKLHKKNFRASLGKSGQNPSYPKYLPAPTP